MSGISTHVLNTALGRPAAGVRVTLERATPDDYATPWLPCGSGVTDQDGRCTPLLPEDKVQPGTYRLTFATAAYFAAMSEPTLYPEIILTFLVDGDGASYHIPLLLSPFGYTTYRGS